MTKSIVIASTLAAITIAGCDKTVQPGDMSPPEITVAEVTAGAPVIMATDPSDTAAALDCGGVGSLNGYFTGVDAATYHVLAPGQTDVARSTIISTGSSPK